MIEKQDKKKKKKNVLFVLDHLGIGGVQEFILNYCKIIKKHKVTVLCLFGKDVYSTELKKEKVNIVFLSQLNHSYFNILTFRVFFKFRNYMEDNFKKFDVIHIKFFAVFLYASLLRLYKYKHVTAGLDCGNKQLPIPLRIIYFLYARKYFKFFLPRFYWKEYKFLRLNKNKIVPTLYFTSVRKSTKPYKYSHKFNILTIGRCIKQKGFIDVLKLYIELSNLTEIDLGLYIIGDGPYRKKVEQFIQKQNIKQVYCLGNILNLEDYIESVDLIIKMAYGEGTNSVIREAMLMGKFVVSTIETPECIFLSKKKALIPIDRFNILKSAKQLAQLIKNKFNRYNKKNIKKTAKKLWDDKLVIAQYV